MRTIQIPPDILTEEQCLAYLQSQLWGGAAPICPYCGSKRVTILKERGRYHCNGCNSPYSITAQTIFHHSHLPLHKWFVTVASVLEDKDRISARKLALLLGINRNTANDMIKRINQRMKEAEHRVLLEAIATMVFAVRDNTPKE